MVAELEAKTAGHTKTAAEAAVPKLAADAAKLVEFHQKLVVASEFSAAAAAAGVEQVEVPLPTDAKATRTIVTRPATVAPAAAASTAKAVPPQGLPHDKQHDL